MDKNEEEISTSRGGELSPWLVLLALLKSLLEGSAPFSFLR